MKAPAVVSVLDLIRLIPWIGHPCFLGSILASEKNGFFYERKWFSEHEDEDFYLC